MKNWFTQILIFFMVAGTSQLMAQNLVTSFDFDGDLQGWTSNTITGDSGWVWSPDGDVGMALTAQPGTVIQSATASNGAAMFNGDFYITQGVNNPGSPPYPQFISELISPTIDVSSVTTGISVRFTQLLRHLNLATGGTFRTSLSFSTDDGVNWSDPIELNPDLMVNDPIISDTRTASLVGAAGTSTLRIKFTYAQDFYFWVLDDIEILEREGALDMRVNDNFFAIAENAQTPSGHLGEMKFLHDIQNIGGIDAENVNLNISIRNAQNMEVYTADKSYGTIGIDSLAENEIFGAYQNDGSVGRYSGVYTVSADGTDSDPSNNSTVMAFEVTDGVFSKDLGATRSVTPAADNSFSYGCHYTVRQPGYAADKVTMGLIFNQADRPVVVGREIFVWLYEWNDENEDAVSQESERVFRGIGSYTIQGDEDYRNGLFDVQLDPWADPDDLMLQENTEYIVAIEYMDDPGAPASCFFAAAQNLDYGAMVFLQDSIGDPRYAGMLDVGLTGEFSSLGFGYDLVPVARLNVMKTNSTDRVELDENVMTIFPNPASYNMNVDVELEEASDIKISMWTVDGRMLFQEKHDNIKSSTFNYNVAGLSNGNYILKLSSDQGYKSKSVTVQR